jgi:hypothetical protein
LHQQTLTNCNHFPLILENAVITIPRGLLLGLVASILFTGTLAAEPKATSKPIATQIDRKMKPVAGPALTSGECKGLGGTISAALACETGNGCFAADENGTVHMHCIDEVKH